MFTHPSPWSTRWERRLIPAVCILRLLGTLGTNHSRCYWSHVRLVFSGPARSTFQSYSNQRRDLSIVRCQAVDQILNRLLVPTADLVMITVIFSLLHCKWLHKEIPRALQPSVHPHGRRNSWVRGSAELAA